MTQSHFDPIYKAHAIDRCAIAILFDSTLPPKALKRVADRASARLSQRGFQEASLSGVTVDLATGKARTAADDGSRAFNARGGRLQLFVLENAIVWNDQDYVRWLPFIGQFEEVTSQLVGEYLESVSVSAIKLEYIDRFVWSSSDWSSFTTSDLLKQSSGLIADKPRSMKREWHSHCGWFEPVDGFRRLTNVNIDVISGSMPGGPTRPSVAVLTSMQDQANVPGYGNAAAPTNLDLPFALHRLNRLHTGLKLLLADIINEEMANRIGLVRPTNKG